MKNRGLIILSVAAIVAMVVASRIVAGMLPEGAVLPVHWGADGQPNGFADRWTALFLPAGVTLLVTLVMAVVSYAEPMQAGLAKSAGVYRVVWIGLIGLMGAIELLEINAALHWGMPVSRVLMGAVGVFFVAIGNQLGKSRPMYLVGIRTPWTLANEDVWIATHRLGGKLMVAAGAVWFVLAALGVRGEFAAPVGIVVLVAASIVPVVYSYVLWRRLPASERVS